MSRLTASDAPNIFQAVISNDRPFSHMSSKAFSDHALAVIKNGIKESDIACFHHSSPECLEKDICFSCMLPDALSALESIFDCNKATTDEVSSECHDGISTQSSVSTSSQHSSLDDTQAEQDAGNSWCCEVAERLQSANILDSLMKCLKCRNKVAAFLARKVILRGIKTYHFQVSHVLQFLKDEWTQADHHPPVAIIEILTDLMSQRMFQDHHVKEKTFTLMKNLDFWSPVLKKVDTNSGKRAFSKVDGLLEYLILLHKIFKHGMLCLEDGSTNCLFVCSLAQNTLVPCADAFFSLTKVCKGHLICSKYLKAVSTILDLRFLENGCPVPECVSQLGVQLESVILNNLLMAQNGGLLSRLNFIGSATASQVKDDDSIESVSTLTRFIIIVTLKACAVTLKGDAGHCRTVANTLWSFWNQLSSIISQKDDPYTNDWLPLVFGDQDDQWIASLFSLLIIHKELRKWKGNTSHHTQHPDKKPADSDEVSIEDLLHSICPHRLFLQLARFVDFDHLVLADFLTSPETSFLSYFTQYIHILGEDWKRFQCTCLLHDSLIDEDRNISHSANRNWSSKESLKTGSRNSESEESASGHLIPSSTTSPDTSVIMHKHQQTSSVFNFEHCQQDSPISQDQLLDATASLHVSEDAKTIQKFSSELNNQVFHLRDNTSSGLVTYSDSDSDDYLEEVCMVLTTQRHPLKRPLSSDSSNNFLDDGKAKKAVKLSSAAGSSEEEEDEKFKHRSVVNPSFHHHDQGNNSEVDLVMGMLIRLSLHVERLNENGLFPYNAKPLLHLLEKCENMYENSGSP